MFEIRGLEAFKKEKRYLENENTWTDSLEQEETEAKRFKCLFQWMESIGSCMTVNKNGNNILNKVNPLVILYTVGGVVPVVS